MITKLPPDAAQYRTQQFERDFISCVFKAKASDLPGFCFNKTPNQTDIKSIWLKSEKSGFTAKFVYKKYLSASWIYIPSKETCNKFAGLSRWQIFVTNDQHETDKNSSEFHDGMFWDNVFKNQKYSTTALDQQQRAEAEMTEAKLKWLQNKFEFPTDPWKAKEIQEYAEEMTKDWRESNDKL